MKKPNNSYLNFIFLFGIMVWTSNCERNEDEALNGTEVKVSNNELKHANKGKLKHLLLFQFNEKTSTEVIQGFIKGLCAFKDSIKEVKDIEWGKNFNNDYNDKYTYCFLLTFNSMNDFLVYLNHPVHLNFTTTWLYPNIHDFLAFDYWANIMNGNETSKSNNLVRHMTLLNYRNDSLLVSKAGMKHSYNKLTNEVRDIQGFEWGKEIQRLGLSKGLEYVFLMTFKNKTAYYSYLRHPLKKNFCSSIIPNPEDVLVVDYFINK